jgi:hypothetical protein
MFPLPHPSGRARKQGFGFFQTKFFKNNDFIQEYERLSYGHEEKPK